MQPALINSIKNATGISAGFDPELLDIIEGLQKEQKEFPSKFFYDERGSKLFDEICKLDEYYPTRTETNIMLQNINEMKNLICSGTLIIEMGSGSSNKTRILLDNLPELAGYIPIDISRDHLFETTETLKRIYPNLDIMPIWADYNLKLEVPDVRKDVSHKLAYFPGSTIGNFRPKQTINILKNIRDIVSPRGSLLIGIDLVKDSEVLNQAYNDGKGVTAEFNLNMLNHINREFGADFKLDQFEHYAYFNEEQSRIEMHLVSKADQTVKIDNQDFFIEESETILSEVSYKYSLEGFSELAAKAGFAIEKVWTDANDYFSVQYLRAK